MVLLSQILEFGLIESPGNRWGPGTVLQRWIPPAEAVDEITEYLIESFGLLDGGAVPAVFEASESGFWDGFRGGFRAVARAGTGLSTRRYGAGGLESLGYSKNNAR